MGFKTVAAVFAMQRCGCGMAEEFVYAQTLTPILTLRWADHNCCGGAGCVASFLA